ncbi:MAG: S9 family peptidase, partial [Gemmatimonadetes bacterium]|nr:S9 family peptidase [Gemmatimonadota bacterium]
MIRTRGLGRALLVTLGLSFVVVPLAAQQRSLDHEDVLHWNQIDDPSLSPDGRWVAYVLTAMEGDPELHVRPSGSEGPVFSARGSDPVFSDDSRFLVFRVPAPEAVTDSLKREGIDGDDLPKDTLAVADLPTLLGGGQPDDSGVERLGPVLDVKLAETGNWIAYRIPDPEDDELRQEGAGQGAGPKGSAEQGAAAEEDEEDTKKKEPGSTLILADLAGEASHSFPWVIEYAFAENGEVFAFLTSTEDGAGDGAYRVALGEESPAPLMEGTGQYKALAVADDGSATAFLSDAEDYESEQPEFKLYHARESAGAGAVASAASPGMPEGWWVSEHGEVSFSDEGSRIHLGTAPRPEPEVEDDILEEDQVRLDVWNWKDPYLQPMQLVQLEDELKRSYGAVVHVDGMRFVQLASPEVPQLRFATEAEGRYALGTTDIPHRQLLSWDGRYSDLYAVDMATGEQRLVAEKVKGFSGGNISPGGDYAYWWDGESRHWMVSSLADGSTHTASANVPHPVWYELDDHPDLPPSYGSAGWTEGDQAFLFYDKYDIWRFEPSSGEITNLTDGVGRATGVRYTYTDTEPELDHVPEGEVLLSTFHVLGKQRGFAQGRTAEARTPAQVLSAEKRFRFRGKAEHTDRWLVTREDFREFPDLWVTDGSITDMAKRSEANPQQEGFTWGTAELVEWASNDGISLQGMVFKPDGFDPEEKYPMMVYFYERMSDGLHNYRSPRPGSSSISVPFYVSRGYVVFIPDIPYEIGYPGESALDAVVPGVLSLAAQGFVDEENIGVQGHSWGGYQIAYMITKTNLFAAAEAGAPVSNMTSAYGGIRWQSGMSRMFQYERTQSRIGGTLWESTNEYLHNSPLFYADKIQTPLLMMHNDEDGAVPWYQGIEMFVAMRRLQKPV